jgi:hypothetical protein
MPARDTRLTAEVATAAPMALAPRKKSRRETMENCP